MDLVKELEAEEKVLVSGIKLLRTLQRDEQVKLRELENAVKERK
jgi:hypothetical protein